MESNGIAEIAEVIRLAVAPVFLLAGLGGMLSVMTNRLGRTVDRSRVLTERALRSDDDPSVIQSELSALSRRLKLISYAIILCTLTAGLICTVIITLFLGAFLKFNISMVVAILFIAAMFTFFSGLLTFLREILLAGTTFRSWEHAKIPQPPPTATPDGIFTKKPGR